MLRVARHARCTIWGPLDRLATSCEPSVCEVPAVQPTPNLTKPSAHRRQEAVLVGGDRTGIHCDITSIIGVTSYRRSMLLWAHRLPVVGVTSYRRSMLLWAHRLLVIGVTSYHRSMLLSGSSSPGQASAGGICLFVSGTAASRSHWSAVIASAGEIPAATARSVSATAHDSTNRSSCSPSSSVLAITSSPSLSDNSRARCRDTQSHWRQRCEQNSFGRPGPLRTGRTIRHHRQRSTSLPCTRGVNFVMTK